MADFTFSVVYRFLLSCLPGKTRVGCTECSLILPRIGMICSIVLVIKCHA